MQIIGGGIKRPLFAHLLRNELNPSASCNHGAAGDNCCKYLHAPANVIVEGGLVEEDTLLLACQSYS